MNNLGNSTEGYRYNNDEIINNEITNFNLDRENHNILERCSEIVKEKLLIHHASKEVKQ